ncbi:Uncharacterised protein [Actinobacillus pleuropneumoniae]|nr:Uncharacterised protein [Actinobacillus pleuropneumoniae]
MGTYAGLDGPQRFGISIAGRHIQLFPYAWQIFLLHADQIQTLSAGYLDDLNVVLKRYVRNFLQILRRGNAAVHSWHYRVCAVFLNVGVHPLIDEAGFPFLLMGHRIQHGQIIMDGGTAFRAALRVAEVQNMHDFLRRGQPLGADFSNDFVPVERGARAYALFACRLKAIAQYALKDLLHDRLAASARTGRSRASFDFVHGRETLKRHGIHNGFFGYAVAAADDFIVGHLIQREGLAASFPCTLGAHDRMIDLLGHGRLFSYHGLKAGRIADIPEQYRADDDVVAQQDFLIGLAPIVLRHDHRVLGLLHKLSCGEYINAADFQFRRYDAALVRQAVHAAEMLGENLSLLEQRRNQAVTCPPMLAAFANRIHIRPGGLKIIVDYDSPVHFDSARLGGSDVRSDTHGHDHEFRFKLISIFEPQPRDPFITHDFRGLFA